MPDQFQMQHVAHLDALRKYARRKRVSEEIVVAVFEGEWLRLTQGAKVERFVGIVAEKRTRRTISS